MSHISSMAIFVRVVDVGTFSGAARDLGVSKSHVSKQISQLEDRLGVRLLQRTTRSLTLTEVGRAYHERASQILADIEEAELAITQLHTAPRGTLRLSVPMSFGMSHIAPLLAEFMQRYPKLHVDVSLTDRRIDLIDEGFDLAVRIGTLGDSSLIARKLAPSGLTVCASPDYLKHHPPLDHPDDLRQHQCLLYAYQTTGMTWPFTGPNGPFSVRVDGRLKANNGDLLREATLAGVGVGLMPDFMVHGDLKNGRLVALLTDWRPRQSAIWAIYPHNRHLSTKVRLFVDFLSEAFSPAPPWA